MERQHHQRLDHFVVALLLVLTACCAGVGVALLSSVAMSTWGYGAGLVAFFTAGPALIIRYAHRGEGMSLLPAITGFLILEFAVGAVFYRTPRVDSVLGDLLFAYTPGSLGVGLVIAVGSWALLVGGYYLSRFVDAPLSRIPRPSVDDTAIGVVTTLIVVGYLTRAIMVRNGWYFHITDEAVAASGARNIVVVLAGLPLVATAMMGALYYRGRSTLAIFFWPLVLLEAAWAIGSGGRAPLLSLGLMLIVARAYGSPKPFPTGRAVLLAAIAVIVIFPLVATYRDIGASSNSYNSDPSGRLWSATARMASDYSVNPAKVILTGVDQTSKRFAGVTSLAAIVHHGTEHYPVEPGQALGTYAGALVPRVLLPSKTDASTFGADFGSRYGITPPGARTSVAMTNIGDLWGTFGLGGLAVGMLVLGGVVRALNVYLRERRENFAVLGIYAAMLGSFLLNFETSIATGLLQTLRALVIYLAAVGLAGATIRLMRGYPWQGPRRLRHAKT